MRTLAVVRNGDRVAYGVQFPSETVVVEWDREAFPEGERTDESSQSIYASISDAEEATGGTVEFVERA